MLIKNTFAFCSSEHSFGMYLSVCMEEGYLIAFHFATATKGVHSLHFVSK